MSLSSENPKEIIDTVLLLGDVLTAVKALPNIEEIAKKAYAITEKEQAKAEEARQNIATYQATIAEAKKQQALLEQANADLDRKKEEIAGGLKAIDDKTRAMNTKEITLNKREGDLTQRENDLAKGKEELLAGINQLASDRGDYKRDKDALDVYEAGLKETAEQMQSLTRKL